MWTEKLNNDQNFQVFESCSNLPFSLTLCPGQEFEYGGVFTLSAFTLSSVDSITVYKWSYTGLSLFFYVVGLHHPLHFDFGKSKKKQQKKT